MATIEKSIRSRGRMGMILRSADQTAQLLTSSLRTIQDKSAHMNAGASLPMLAKGLARADAGVSLPMLSKGLARADAGASLPMLSKGLARADAGASLPMLSKGLARADAGASLPALTNGLALSNEPKVDLVASIGPMIQAQEKMNRSMQKGGQAVDELSSKLRKLVTQNAGAVLAYSDQMTGAKTKIQNINDGRQSDARLNQMTFNGAQASRTPYFEMANTVSTLGQQLGNTFSNSGETVAFAEQLNKQFLLAGMSGEGMNTAVTQFAQGLSSGVMQGESLNSVLKTAPGIVQSIADYMGTDVANVQQMANAGMVSADVVKNAMLASADETNQKFSAMPLTWAQAFSILKDRILFALQPIFEIIAQGAGWLVENWDAVVPVLAVVAAGVLALAAAVAVAKIQTLLLNAALLANPIFWIAMAIVLVIALIASWIQSMGGLQVAWLVVVNAILTKVDNLKIGLFTAVYAILNAFDYWQLGMLMIKTNILNLLGDLKAKGLMILQNFINGAIDGINELIKKTNAITGLSFSTIQHVTFGTEAVFENIAAKSMRNAELFAKASEVNENVAGRDASLKQMKADAAKNAAGRQAEIAKLRAEKSQTNDKAQAKDYNLKNMMPQNTAVQNGLAKDNAIAQNMTDTAANTGSMAANMEVSTEDLKYLRDVAERETINRFTTAQLSVSMTTSASINSELDIDGIISQLEDKTYQTLIATAEGV